MTLQRFQQFLWSEDGPTSVEYAVLLALIAAAVIGAVLSMSNATADSFDNSASQLSGSLGS
jgi:pilus assembly protein Flp/PilA